jgi:DNA-binding response OmpR family regulator
VEKRILLVEDNADFREAFTRALGWALARERFEVAFVEAGSLAEARARLREGGLDAALIDVGLPDGDGWTSCARSTTAARATASRRSC